MNTAVSPSDSSPLISADRIARAYLSIDAPFRDTPQYESAVLGARFECELVVKIETLNPIRSFKARGAQFFVSELPDRPHLVCCSSGNFGQGMAYAARQRGMRLTVFMQAPGNSLKVASMRALHADVRAISGSGDDVVAEARKYASEHGALFVVDGQEPAIAEGAGTIAMELLRYQKPFDAIVVPLGDGALLGGMACWVKAYSPGTRMIGVCAAGAPAMERSWRTGHIVSATAATLAEGIAIATPCAEALTNLIHLADDIVLVDDAALIAAMRVARLDLGVVLEPSGAAALAALAVHPAKFRGMRIGAVLTGGNVAPEQRSAWL